MWLRFLRFGLFTCVLAVLFSAVMPRTARVYADDITPGNHCRSDAVAFAYYYGENDPYNSAGELLDTYEYADYRSCLVAAQNVAIYAAGRSCYPVSRGTYGIAAARPIWDIFWNEEYQGTVDDQQYDCGEVSVY